MKLRRGLIGMLVFINLCLIGIIVVIKTAPPKKIKPENVTIHKSIDQKESEIHPDFIKEEYIPHIPEGENVAKGKKTTATSFHDVYTPRKVTDGVYTGVSYWEGAADSYPNIITVDLEEVRKIHAVRVCLSPMSIWGKRTQTFAVYISTDNEIFSELAPEKQYVFDPDTGNEVQLQLDEVDARYVQLSFTENTGSLGAQVAELEVYSN